MSDGTYVALGAMGGYCLYCLVGIWMDWRRHKRRMSLYAETWARHTARSKEDTRSQN